MDNQKIGMLHDFAGLKTQKTKHSTYERANPINDPINVINKNALVGIEIEVENMGNGNYEPAYYWQVKEDGSLRNNGVEFTSIPLRASQVEYALDVYNRSVTQSNTPDYSPRTSVHVHLNIRDLTWDQLKNLIILYCLFEKHFFHIAGTRRENSIFCVPLYKTQPKGTISNLQDWLISWQKYYALNLTTVLGTNGLPAYGTVEFRHLYGTGDKHIILSWINNILALREEAMRWDTKELLNKVKQLNTTSEYVAMYQNTFGPMCMMSKMIKHDFESCVSFVKSWEWGNTLRATKYPFNLTSVYTNKYKKAVEQLDNNNTKQAKETWYYKNTPITVVKAVKPHVKEGGNEVIVTVGNHAFKYIQSHEAKKILPNLVILNPFIDLVDGYNLIYFQDADGARYCCGRKEFQFYATTGTELVRSNKPKPILTELPTWVKTTTTPEGIKWHTIIDNMATNLTNDTPVQTVNTVPNITPTPVTNVAKKKVNKKKPKVAKLTENLVNNAVNNTEMDW